MAKAASQAFGKSAQQTAKTVGTSRDKVEKVRTVLKDETQKQAVLSGQKTINKAYNDAQAEKRVTYERSFICLVSHYIDRFNPHFLCKRRWRPSVWAFFDPEPPISSWEVSNPSDNGEKPSEAKNVRFCLGCTILQGSCSISAQSEHLESPPIAQFLSSRKFNIDWPSCDFRGLSNLERFLIGYDSVDSFIILPMSIRYEASMELKT